MNDVVKQDMIFTADNIINKLLESKPDEKIFNEESLNLLHAFETLATEEKIAVEERLIELLNDTKQDLKHRAWITGILGRVGTKSAKDALINRFLDDKEEYLVKRWAVGTVIRSRRCISWIGHDFGYVLQDTGRKNRAGCNKSGADIDWFHDLYLSLFQKQTK